MLSKCANPSCTEEFKYLGKGKLFLAEPDSVLMMSGEEITASCYWLCETCCAFYRVEFVDAVPVLRSLVQEVPAMGPKIIKDSAA